jgi:hypothetical protein
VGDVLFVKRGAKVGIIFEMRKESPRKSEEKVKKKGGKREWEAFFQWKFVLL